MATPRLPACTWVRSTVDLKMQSSIQIQTFQPACHTVCGPTQTSQPACYTVCGPTERSACV